MSASTPEVEREWEMPRLSVNKRPRTVAVAAVGAGGAVGTVGGSSRSGGGGGMRRTRRGMKALLFALACGFALMVGSLGIRPPPVVRLRGASARRLQALTSTSSRVSAGGGDGDGEEVTLAFFLQISDSTIEHLPRLLRRIWEPCNQYTIHVDAKAKASGAGALRGLKERLQAENGEYARNVHFMEPELITYRGVSMLLNTINGMQLLLEKAPDFDFFINLSGSDYPLVTPKQQRKLLASASRQHNYFAFAPPEKWAQNNLYRYSHFWVDEALAFPQTATASSAAGSGGGAGIRASARTTIMEIARKNPISDASQFVYTNAEAWMINSRQFCEYVTKSAAARKLLVTFAFSVESSEHYFSTLAYNSKFNGTVVHSSLRHVVWEHAGKAAGQHPFYVDERMQDGQYPLLQKVLDSPKFYTRKLKHANSPVMDIIDRRADDPKHLEKVEQHFKWLIQTARQRAEEQTDVKLPFD